MITDLHRCNCIKGWHINVKLCSELFVRNIWSAIYNAHNATFSWNDSSLHFMTVFNVEAMLITCSITNHSTGWKLHTSAICAQKSYSGTCILRCLILNVLHPPTFFYQSQQKSHDRNILFLPNFLIIHSIRAQVSQFLSFLILITGNQKRKPISSYNFMSPLLRAWYL